MKRYSVTFLLCISLAFLSLGAFGWAGVLWVQQHHSLPQLLPIPEEHAEIPYVASFTRLPVKVVGYGNDDYPEIAQQLNTPVRLGGIKDGRWVVYSDALSLMVIPGKDPTASQFIIYGHNWKKLMGGMLNMQVGDIITLGFADATETDFVISHRYTIKPHEIDKVVHTGDLVLYTCSGWWDEHREVWVAQTISPLIGK